MFFFGRTVAFLSINFALLDLAESLYCDRGQSSREQRMERIGHGSKWPGRLRMIEHAQEVMAGGSVRRVPLLAEVRDCRDPFAEDVRERPHTPIIDGNLRPFRFNVTAGRSEMRPFNITTNRPSTRNEACTPRSGYCSTALDCLDESCSPSPPYLLRKMVLRRR